MSEIITLTSYAAKLSAKVENHFVRLDKLNDESIIVDAGACLGETIRDLRGYEQTKKCKIFAIECNKKLAEDLRRQKLSNVEICEKALVGQNIDGDVTFFESGRGPRWGSIKPARLTKRWRSATDSYKVKTLKMNDIFNEFGIDKIDYIKMDIEACEQMIFNTMSMETAKKIKQLSVEIHWPKSRIGITMQWAEKRLKELGFEIKHKARVEIFCERE